MCGFSVFQGGISHAKCKLYQIKNDRLAKFNICNIHDKLCLIAKPLM